MTIFSYSRPHSAYAYKIAHDECLKLLTDAAKKGVSLLNKQINYQLLLAYQNYVISILDIASQKLGNNYIYLYNQFSLSISCLTPYEQVRKIVEFILNLAKNM